MNLIFEQLNSIGLVLDIVGAIILFKYGIPEKIDKDGNVHLLLEDVDEDEIKKAKKYKLYSRIGIMLLIIGFSLQLISNFISS